MRFLPGLLVVLGIVAALVLLLWVFQRKLIYLPFGGSAPSIRSVLGKGEDVSFETEDGLTLSAWFVPPDSPPPHPTVLVFNGNAGDRSDRVSLAIALSGRGLAALMCDYRGYGGNPGRPTEAGLALDARAARAFVESRDDVDPDRIVYFGESLGTGVAVALAVSKPPAAMVLRSPFTSLVDTARVHYPFLPVGSLLSDRYESIEIIDEIAVPLLVIAGDRDGIVPPAQSRAIYDAAPGPKRLLMLQGVGHNDDELQAGPRMMREISSFLSALPAFRPRR